LLGNLRDTMKVVEGGVRYMVLAEGMAISRDKSGLGCGAKKGSAMWGANGATRCVMIVAVVLSSLVVGGTAAADYVDGNRLFDECQSGGESQEWKETTPRKTFGNWGLCYGYIQGVADALAGTSYCLPTGPSGVEVEQVVDVVNAPVTAWFMAWREKIESVVARLLIALPCCYCA
jgi:Rap1a immunity proteins